MYLWCVFDTVYPFVCVDMNLKNKENAKRREREANK